LQASAICPEWQFTYLLQWASPWSAEGVSLEVTMRELEQFKQAVEQVARSFLSSPTGAEPYLLSMLAGFLVLALLISLLARDIPTLLATVLLAATAMACIFAPEFSARALGAASVLGSLLVAGGSLAARRRRLAVQRRLEDVESQLIGVRTEMESVFLRQLRMVRQRRSQKAESTEGAEHELEETANVASGPPTSSR
jgi:hypothetical protein